ncbi:hypothetical protein ACHQM5_025635 [Ranunculus cassubicifolius]
MPIRRKQEDVTRIWLDRLAKTKSDVPEEVLCIDNQNRLHEEFQTIQIEIQDITEKLSSIKSLEKLMVEEFNDIEEDLADDIFDEYTVEKQMEIENKFQSINRRIAKIKSMGLGIDWQSVSSSKPIVSKPQQPLVESWKISDDWKLAGVEKGILRHSTMDDFKLSYDRLGIRQKLCLLCFSVFPKNSVIKKRPLIYWWIGEGILSPTQDKTAEQMGEEFLEDLQNQGMINPARTNRSPRVTSYTMHPWIHRMVISAAAKAEFFDLDDAGNIIANSYGSRRSLLVPPGTAAGREATTQSRNQYKEEDLQTLLNINEKFLIIKSEWILKLKKLRVLQLGRWQASARHHIEVLNGLFLNGLGSHNCLKYLSLRGITGITELPSSVSKLIQLKILDLRACHNLKKLPDGIEALEDLTHLDVSECYLLEYMPKGLRSLYSLQVLKGFVVSNSSLKDACHFKDLGLLSKLRKLSVYVASDADIPDEEFDKFHQFGALRVLTITWGGQVQQQPTRDTRRLMRSVTMMSGSISMPKYLEKLDLRCYPLPKPPRWMNAEQLLNLKRLYIRGGKIDYLELDDNEKWKVKILRLKFLSNLNVEWQDLRTAFPELIYMEITKCKHLEAFPCDQDGVWPAKAVDVDS